MAQKQPAYFKAHTFGKTPFWIAERSLRSLLSPLLEEFTHQRLQSIFIFYDPRRGCWSGGRTQEWAAINDQRLHEVEEDLLNLERTITHLKQTGRQIYNLCYDVVQHRSASFSRQAASSRIEHLLKVTEEMGLYAFLLIMLDAPAKNFERTLQDIVTHHVRERVLSRPPHEYLATLLEPVEFSFAELQRDELLFLAQAVRRRAPIKKLLYRGGNPRDILNEMMQRCAPLTRKLLRHMRHYSWIIARGGGAEDAPRLLLDQLKNLITAHFNLEAAITEREEGIRQRHDQQRLLIRELGLTEDERRLFNAARDIASALRHWREMLLLLQSVCHDLVRAHVRDRSDAELSLLSSNELLWILGTKIFNKETYETRKKGFVWHATHKTEEWITGAKVKAWRKKEMGN